MVPPATVATLRTTEIVVAFVAQILLTNVIPQIIDSIGAALVFFAALSIIFEKHIYNGASKLFCCKCCNSLPMSKDTLSQETNHVTAPQSIISRE